MRLLDQVAHCREPVLVSLPGRGVWELPGAATLAASVAATPVRYVLAEEVRGACHEIAARWPELMDPNSGTLRLPVPAMWIEWTDLDAVEGPRRTGMLVRAGDSDRSGTIHVFWEDPITGAEMAQAHIRFDLDRVLAPGDAASEVLARFPGLRVLAPHFLMAVEPEWLRYFTAMGGESQPLRSTVAHCSAQAMPTFPFLVSLLRLLAVRKNVSERPVERRELNRARARRGKPPLLDHVEVSLSVGAVGAAAHAQNGGRTPCRQHVVRGHLVNRHGTIFWRSTHLRGEMTIAGRPLKRNVRVSVAKGYRPQLSQWPEMEMVAAE